MKLIDQFDTLTVTDHRFIVTLYNVII